MTLERVTLRDGHRVLVRPVVPEDRRLIAEGLERLSLESRYRRFHSPISKLSSAQLDYLTQVDHHDHEALIAVDEETGEPVGVARFVRLSGDVAECAVTIADAWQGRGLGSGLLDRLVDRAQEEGIARFAASVLGHNAEALAVLSRLGDTVRHQSSGPAVELEITLPTPAGRGALHQLLRETALGVLTPAVELWRLVAARGAPEGPEASARDVVVVAASAPEAVAAARELAATLDCELHLVGSWWPLLGDRERAETALAEHARSGERTHLEPGSLAEALLTVAGDQRARLVVVEAGPSGLDRLADRVSHHAPANVLVVRTGARRAPGGRPSASP